ncbi:MAG: hypothetical protein H6722_28495 [Sandaracinus sp.]|nr:hypothetical protein [Myxococcales bacterium]MCB9616394.1 hypothetical protein [Sandaracinus sp.]MCB9619929.1 hypothetical protein [Sandaracinus sp.]
MTRLRPLFVLLPLLGCARGAETHTTPTAAPGEIEVSLQDAPPPERYVRDGESARYVAWWRAEDSETYERLGTLSYDDEADVAQLVAQMPRSDLSLLVTVEESLVDQPRGFVVLRAECDVTSLATPAVATTGPAQASATAAPTSGQTIVSCEVVPRES